jgi:regulator of replication initiation timing
MQCLIDADWCCSFSACAHRLNGMAPSQVLLGLTREESNLKQLKNSFLEEMDRVQLEAMLLRRQLEELQNPRHQESKESEMDAQAAEAAGDPDEHLRMLIEDDLAQIAAADAAAPEGAPAASSSSSSNAHRIPHSSAER